MKWEKKGLICSHETLDLPWYKKNTMVPLPYLINDETLRIFITMCDEDNVGRIGFVDVNPDNPSEIIGHSKEPVLDIGADGCFDDSGVITASIVDNGDEVLFYYSGYERKVKVPYTIFSGLAISKDKGQTFTRYKDTPLLDRIPNELYTRSSPVVQLENGTYKMWYTGEVKDGWIHTDEGKKMPVYTVKYLESVDGKEWGQVEGCACLAFKSKDEYGFSKPDLWHEDNKYKMMYSIRTLSKGYRFGYAESDDGIVFARRDEDVGIDVSPMGWDSDMICFGTRYECKGKIYLFYCGNKYGLDGMGYAELVSK